MSWGQRSRARGYHSRVMAKTGENPLLRQALEYAGRGWCIIPIPYGTKKARVKWGRYQETRPDEKQLVKWFGNGRRNMAVVLGPVSGDLVCRDFDTVQAYESWAAAYPDLADRLPTVKTADGYHVYFQAPVRGRKDIKGSNGEHLGELRGSGHYCLLPPSIHPDGPEYRWTIPITENNLLVLDPARAGFLQKNTDVTEQLEQTEQAQQTEQTEQSQAIGEKKEVVVDFDGFVEKTISETLPKRQGQRNRKIFDFAQALRANPRLANAGANEFKPIFKLWFDRALPYIGTKDFETSWFDFLYACERVIFAKGVGMAQILERAKTAPTAKAAEKHQNPKMQLLICWCRELQIAAGNRPFWLSARTVAKYLEVAPMTAWRYLFILAREKVLDEVEKGKMTRDGRLATRYRYIAN
jgi:hypothetical protein